MQVEEDSGSPRSSSSSSFSSCSGSLLDAMGVASIMPFIAILTDPSIITENVYFYKIYSSVGATDQKTFIFGLGVSIFF